MQCCDKMAHSVVIHVSEGEKQTRLAVYMKPEPENCLEDLKVAMSNHPYVKYPPERLFG